MSVLVPGSDLRLAPTLGPLARVAGLGPRRAIDRLAAGAFSAVQLDATLPGIRPRELDRRARRELGAKLRRSSLELAGLDLFVPPHHFTDPTHMDRAMQAATSAIELAGDLGRVPVSIGLPVAELTADQKELLLEAADGHGAPLAVQAAERLASAAEWTREAGPAVAGLDLDPASLLAAGCDPAAVAGEHGDELCVARLSDGRRIGDGATALERTCPGHGELDVLAYRVALDTANRRRGPVVLELRQLADPWALLEPAAAAWGRAAPPT